MLEEREIGKMKKRGKRAKKERDGKKELEREKVAGGEIERWKRRWRGRGAGGERNR